MLTLQDNPPVAARQPPLHKGAYFVHLNSPTNQNLKDKLGFIREFRVRNVRCFKTVGVGAHDDPKNKSFSIIFRRKKVSNCIERTVEVAKRREGLE